ncbi:helix-turn-helix domain-containing protein [Streptomyces sp. 184]|uniref:helix-turn-helix domain-containing protein n=1 Tax=Streptomyces sp. 184 TaxID=1827526 RepID=UPI0038917933
MRIALGYHLRKLREDAGIQMEQLSEDHLMSISKVSRMETGKRACKASDVAELLRRYGVGEPDIALVLELVEGSVQPGWWRPYAKVLPKWFEPLVGLETAAEMIRTCEAQVVPGLMQTEEYARGMATLSRLEDAFADQRVALRLERQDRILGGAEGPRLWAVIEETALVRGAFGAEVMRAQMQRLRHLSEHPRVTLQVVPFDRVYLEPYIPFTYLRFTEPELPNTVYVEYLKGAKYLDGPEDVNNHLEMLDTLVGYALTRRQTQDRLEEAIRFYR